MPHTTGKPLCLDVIILSILCLVAFGFEWKEYTRYIEQRIICSVFLEFLSDTVTSFLGVKKLNIGCICSRDGHLSSQ